MFLFQGKHWIFAVTLVVSLLILSNRSYASIPRVQDTVLPSEDVVIAEYNVKESPYNAIGNGKTDDTQAIQRAVNDAARNGGGVVFIPSGVYRLDSTLTVARGVTIRGEWISPTEEDMSVKGTILAAYSGKGNEDGLPLITLLSNSSIQNMNIWYPEQEAEHPIPYPWTIAFTDKDGIGHHVRNITLVNSYKGIGHGYEGDINIYNNNIIRNIYGTPLKYGAWFEFNLDRTRIYRIRFSPDYWKQSGLPGSPQGEIYEHLLSWLAYNGTGLTIRKVDGYEVYSANIDGYGIGIKLSYNRNLGEDSPHPRVFGPFGGGAMYDVCVKGARVGLHVDGIGSAMISNSQFYADKGDDATAIAVTDVIHQGLQFNQVILFGSSRALYVKEGISNSIVFRDRRVAIHNIISIQNSMIMTCNQDRYAIHASSGQLSVQGSEFQTQGPHIFIDENVRRAVVIGNMFSHRASIDNKIASRAVLDHQEIELARFEDVVYPFPSIRRPRKDDLFVVTEFGAKGNGSTDDTDAFVAALKTAADNGGGTVYVPAGTYRITSSLRIQAGVELRGTFEALHHTEAPGSVILVHHSAGQEAGNAAVILASNSGVRGLTFWYPLQDYFDIKPYAWTIQSAGSGCWVKDITLGNSYRGVDFGTAEDNSDHFVSGVYGAPLREGLRIDNSSRGGFVENCHFIEYFGPVNQPSTEDGPMYNDLVAYSFGHAENEFILDLFVFAANRGIEIFQSNSGPFRSVMHLGCIDVPQVALEVNAPDVQIDVVGWWAAPSYYKAHSQVATGPQFTGTLRLFNSNSWGYGAVLNIYGHGTVVVQQLNTDLAVSRIMSGHVSIENCVSREGHLFNIGADVDEVLLVGNMSDSSLRLSNRAGAKAILIHNNPDPGGFMWSVMKIGGMIFAVIGLLAYLSMRTR